MKNHIELSGTYRLLVGFALYLCLLVTAMNCYAQSGSGTIQGTVQDPSGAVISGASVKIMNVDTGQVVGTVTNSAGLFLAPPLVTGHYKVSIMSSGMTTWEGDVVLQAGQAAVISPKLAVAGTQQAVTVVGDITPLVTNNSPTISSTLENQRILQLPMNGRSVSGLVGLTTPGVEGAFVHGNRPNAFEYVQDGAPLVNDRFGGANVLPDPDAIQEVRVETQNSSAKFNRPATAELTTKSGTNQLHGTAFETARNNSFGIAKRRQDTFTNAPKYIRNEFGVSAGGPIYIPKLYHGRNKSFFFAAYERYSLRQGTSLLLYVPSTAMRNGDFSGIPTGNPQNPTYTIYDSLSPALGAYQRQPFPNNQIQMSRESPLAKALYAITPAPTTNDNPYVAPNWAGPTPNNQTNPQASVRLDHVFNDKNSAFLRYTYIANTGLTMAGSTSGFRGSGQYGPPPTGNVSDVTLSTLTSHSAGLSYTHTFSPTFFSETVLGNMWEGDAAGAYNGNQNYADQLGLPNPFGNSGFPFITGSMTAQYAMGQTNGDSSIVTSIDENLTTIRGRHTFQYGGRWRHDRMGNLPGQNPSSALTFGSYGTADYDPSTGTAYTPKPFTGIADADVFLGYADAYSSYLNMQYGHNRQQEIDAYFQDDFRVNDYLTVNTGLRWEAHPAYNMKYNYGSSFDVKNKAIVLRDSLDAYYKLGYTTPSIIAAYQNLGVKFEDARAAGLSPGMYRSQNFTFGPRLGLAYRPFGNRKDTVLRLGYGTYIYPIPPQNIISGSVPFAVTYTHSFTNAAQTPDGIVNYNLRGPQTVIAGQNSSNVVDTTQNPFAPGLSTNSVASNYPVTYVEQWNVTLEQPIRPTAVLRVTYSGDHGRNLEQDLQINTAPSDYVWYMRTGQPKAKGLYASIAQNPYDQTTYGAIAIQQKSGYSNDNSAEINYQRLYRNGYAFQLYYVFSAAFRNGGNGWRDSNIYVPEDFAPGAAPYQNQKTLNHFLNYTRDTNVPQHRIRWNFIVDVPVGRGKHFMSNANRFMDELVGGWQIAGDGSVNSQYFLLSTSNWGQTSPIHIYKHGHPVQDCRSGVCYQSYLYFNGYIPPSQRNTPKGVNGLPADYTPYQIPIGTDPAASNYLTNNVTVQLNNGTTVTTGYNPGPGTNPLAKTYLPGPFNWTQDLSLFKQFAIHKNINLKVNVDAFNVFNEQGYVNPDTTAGIQSLRSSYNTARQLQLTARLTW